MNWLLEKIKSFFCRSTCQSTCQTTDTAAPAEEAPSEQELKEMKMADLRALAASRGTAGSLKGVTRRELTKLIKQSYQR